MNRKISTAIACIAALLTAAPAAASTNGTLGATSQGSIQISVSVPNRAQITGLNDVTFGSVDPANEATSAQSVCVWSNTKTHAYSITASGSGAGNAFSLANPEGTSAATYTVAWADQAGATGGTALTAGTPLAGQNSGATTPTCSNGTKSATLTVSMSPVILQQMASNTNYTGALTLVVAPQ